MSGRAGANRPGSDGDSGTLESSGCGGLRLTPMGAALAVQDTLPTEQNVCGNRPPLARVSIEVRAFHVGRASEAIARWVVDR